MLSKIFLLCLTVAIGNCAKFPSGFERCEIGNSLCVHRTAQTVIDLIEKNSDYKKFNLPEMNPLRVEQISLKQGSDSPVNIELKLKNIDVYGLNTIKVKKVEGFERGLNKPIVIDFSTSLAKFIGNYTIDGRVVFLPIVGDGLCNLELNDVVGWIKFKVKLVEIKGKEHIKIQNSKLKFDISRMQLNFDNLFNGLPFAKQLGDDTNLFLNENWRDIFDELKENVFDVMGQVLVAVADRVLTKFSYTELFIDDQYTKA